MLRFRIARRPARRLRLCLHVRGLASRDCPVTISINDAPPEMFTVAASTSSWLIAEISASNEVISVLVDGRASEAVPFSVCGMGKTAVTTIAILGFLLDDHADALVAKALSAERSEEHTSELQSL